MNNREKITLGVFMLSICLLVVSNIEKNAYASAMVYPDRGSNIFSESEFLPLPGTGMAAISAVADFDQDGFDDLLAYNGSGGVMVTLNLSGSGFYTVWETGGGSWRTADVNGDGFPDLIKGASGNNVEIYINQLGPDYACATDLDKDGETSVGDLLFVLAEWGPCE